MGLCRWCFDAAAAAAACESCGALQVFRLFSGACLCELLVG